ncbi:MAG: nicotinate (nicotinamide) nucleotide adenylyltransferase [Peptostreptococcaceae bacterium]|nr:nicotinate (nicotinamide) nucleotide adenylyltransferase [Peptostreptococcaceae bacterium]
MNKIGIYGGTFDPIHKGHLGLAKDAADECNLDKLIFLPAYVQPFKVGKSVTNGAHRYNMIKSILKIDDRFEVSNFELEKGEISYSYDTLLEFKKLYDAKMFFIMGDDSFIQLEKWFKGKELLKKFSFIIGNRPGINIEKTMEYLNDYREKYDADITLINNKLVDVSATELRKALKTGKDVDKFLPDSVIEYINENKLYK